MKDGCEKGYGKHCFKCNSKNRLFSLVNTGAGMDTEMLEDFGKRQIAINCSCLEGYLVLELNKKEIYKLSNSKVRELSEEIVNNKLIKADDVQSYLDKYGDKVSIEVLQPCRIFPPYP